MYSFNLIDGPFIPCVRADGSSAEYSLRDVLLNAHDLADLRDASPLVTVALHRLLLAILHQVYRGPKNAAERLAIRTAGRFDTDRITGYLEKWKDRFDLFCEKHPFYQRAGFEIEDAAGTNRLAQELACNNNPTLFDHTVNELAPDLSAAEAARAVVCTHAYAVGGGVRSRAKITYRKWH
jgi:CRISPR system Cascade subunit CasA